MHSCISIADRKRHDRLIRKASSLLGHLHDLAVVVGERRMMAELPSVIDSGSHPMQDALAALQSSFSVRLLHPKCVRERYRRSFLPAAVRMYV